MRLAWTTALACFASSGQKGGQQQQQQQHWKAHPTAGSSHLSAASSAAPDDGGETIESLSIKLQQALDNNKEQPLSSSPSPSPSYYPNQREMQLLGSRLSNLSLNRTYVGPSATAGQGLFACRNYPAGTLLTCYPGDGIVEDNEEVSWGDHVLSNDDDDDDDDDEWDSDYLLFLSDDLGLVGLPHLNKDPAYLGHFANDGISQIPRTVQDVVTNYLQESPTKANAMEREVLNNCHMILVATRDIQQDEEIFLSYGPEYWMQQPDFGSGGGADGGDVQ